MACPASFFNPVRSLCAPGAIDRLPGILGDSRCTLVIFRSARARGLLARVQALLGPRLAHTIEDVQPNPDVAQLRHTWTDSWHKHRDADTVVAVGGGSVIDTAKALMVAPQSLEFDDFLAALRSGHPWKPSHVRRLIAIPTTAGTGSEMTPWATIWDRAAHRKLSLHLPETWPHTALVDAELMLGLSPAVTLQSGLDALSHSLEAIWNVNANPISDTFATAAARDILKTLPALMQQPDDLALRAAMALAAVKAGMAFSNTRTALAHSISYEMTLRHGLPHGIACSFTLPMVLHRAMGCDPGRDRVLADALGVPLEQGSRMLRGFLHRLGVKTEFADYGVSDAEAQALIRHAEDGVRGQNFVGRPGKPLLPL